MGKRKVKFEIEYPKCWPGYALVHAIRGKYVESYLVKITSASMTRLIEVRWPKVQKEVQS